MRFRRLVMSLADRNPTVPDSVICLIIAIRSFVFLHNEMVSCNSPRASVCHACHSGSLLDGHHEADCSSAECLSMIGVARFCNILRFVNCLFAQFCKVRVPVYWNRTKPMRSESIGDPSLRLHPSSVCFTIDSSTYFSSRVSDQYAYSHACSKNTVRLHASALPAKNRTSLVKGLEKATYSLDHDTCIRLYDTIHATTPSPSLVCIFSLSVSCRDSANLSSPTIEYQDCWR